jgi:hypothetical protein
MHTKPLWQEWKRENWEWIERPGFEGSWRLKHPNRGTLEAEETSVMRRPPTCRSFGSCTKRQRFWNSWFQNDCCEQYARSGLTLDGMYVPWCEGWEPVFEFAGPKSDPLVYFSGMASRCQSCHDYTTSWLGRYDQPWASSHCCEICSRTGGERHGPWCEAVLVYGPLDDGGLTNQWIRNLDGVSTTFAVQALGAISKASMLRPPSAWNSSSSSAMLPQAFGGSSSSCVQSYMPPPWSRAS